MQSRIRSLYLMAAMSALALIELIPPSPAAAQISKGSWDKPQVAVKPAAPPPKPGKRKPPQPRRAPLLTIQWRVQKRLNGNLPKDMPHLSLFFTGDQIRLVITPNQDGYLHLIRNTKDKDGELIFPDSRINNGDNKVVRNKPYIVPGYCPGFSDPNDCWWTMDEHDGLEEVTAIFTREAATALPSQILGAGGVIKNGDILKLRAEAGKLEIKEKDFTQGVGGAQYVIWVQNTSPKDNNKLIYTIRLIHKERQNGLKQY